MLRTIRPVSVPVGAPVRAVRFTPYPSCVRTLLLPDCVLATVPEAVTDPLIVWVPLGMLRTTRPVSVPTGDAVSAVTLTPYPSCVRTVQLPACVTAGVPEMLTVCVPEGIFLVIRPVSVPAGA